MSKKYKVGDKVICNDFAGVVTRVDVTPGGCVEVRLSSGTACVDPDDLRPVRTTPRGECQMCGAPSGLSHLRPCSR